MTTIATDGKSMAADRLVLTDEGQVYPITNFYDDAGDECEPGEALQVVAGAGGIWFTFDPRDGFEPLVVH